MPGTIGTRHTHVWPRRHTHLREGGGANGLRGPATDAGRGSPGLEVRAPRNPFLLGGSCSQPQTCALRGTSRGAPVPAHGRDQVLRKRSTRVCGRPPRPWRGQWPGTVAANVAWGSVSSPLGPLPPAAASSPYWKSRNFRTVRRCRRCQERVHVRPATLPRRVRGPTWTTGGTKTRQQVTKFSLRPRPPASAPGGSQPLPTRGHLREPQPFAFNVLLAPRRPRPALSWGAVSGKGADGGRRAAGLGGERSRRRGRRLSARGCHLGARLPGQSGTPPSGDRASGGSGLRPDGGGGGGPQAGQHGGRASQRDGGRGPHTSPLAPSLQELGLGSRRFLQIKKKRNPNQPSLVLHIRPSQAFQDIICYSHYSRFQTI